MKAINIHFFLSSIFSVLILSSAADTIPTDQPLTDGNTIISSGGKFELGFFSLGTGTSRKRYLGIWFNNIQTVVWVANRDNPLNDTDGMLNFTRQGNLTLLNGSGRVIWSSSAIRSVQNPIAQLLDSGNLVVRDASKNYLWQSFDYPGDTALPGVKVGIDLKTGFRRSLWSWKSRTDPSKGEFSFIFDPQGFPQPFLMNGTVERFRGGAWNGQSFANSPSLLPSPAYKYIFVFDPEKVYFTYELTDSSIIARVVMQLNGFLEFSIWNNQTQNWDAFGSAPADNCDIYGQCHTYGLCNSGNSPICRCLDKFEPKDPTDWARGNWSGGCVRKVPLNCQKKVKFFKYSGIKLPDTRFSWYGQGVTLNACEELCLRNCSCVAYANLDITGTNGSCLLWFDELMDIREFGASGQDIYIKLDSSEIGTGNSSREKLKILRISLPLAALSLLSALCLILYMRRKKKKKKEEEDQNQQCFSEGRGTRSSEMFRINESKDDDLDLPLFDFATILEATSNFSLNNKLGEGGFGPVYKGILKDGQEIAVKRLSRYSAQGTDEFMNEVIFIAKLQHRNLVKLLGCCIQAEEKMLIYEYMPNKSLDWFLFDRDRSSLLDWTKCIHIINGIARGLLYLHQDSRLRIIHRDLKPSNVLLDIDMNPKISDFGMARSFGGNETGAMTTRVVGTYGYMSPEYAEEGIFSVKSDVFSFGVLVLEILSGKRNRGFFHPDHHHNLLGHVWILFNEGRVLELINAHLRESRNLSEVQRSFHVGLLCVQQCPDDRPSMSSVVLMLSSDVPLPSPKDPGFFTSRSRFAETDSSSSKLGECSGNEISMTLLDAR
ncbi:PREDICTED: G-type lectin S-receptor-like serine/threonine-protein kinase At4g27290 isoform X1 [Nicotiana attenuata]|uniref:Receptor-like serine/threonine-protein kinase n=1 Tax=Nicotiana attenuata TaxID=49451 RepID=A0A1J6HWP7_NICAT|nr:PREDICTED: G-type lectin S-receptor-like serine/threonine-protein kinase At4g27290 isoform X1 [Nicotiana attenuata]OIS96801.1 receptor-like serinethreonine-protein kinase sd1-8 [Nicotiana attenuata]